MAEKYTLGIDIGNRTAKGLIWGNNEVIDFVYLPNTGIVDSLKEVLAILRDHNEDISRKISGVGVTGAGRELASKLIGADITRTEILAQSVGVLHFFPNAKTAIELGGEDSKIIFFEDGMLKDFAMNTLCSSGCGAYLDNVATRFNISIENFSKIALKSKNPITISSRCSVFGTSAALAKLHIGYPLPDILLGVAYGLARNYLVMLAKGSKLKEPVIFTGGVSKNMAVVKAMKNILGCDISTFDFGHITGAIGMAILAKKIKGKKFKGFNMANLKLKTSILNCKDCPNECEVVKILHRGKILAALGSRCGKHNV